RRLIRSGEGTSDDASRRSPCCAHSVDMARTGAALGQTVRVDADEELVFLDPDSAEQAPARVRPRRWLWLLLAAVLVGGVVVQANRHPSAPAAAPSTRSSAFSEVAPAPKT